MNKPPKEPIDQDKELFDQFIVYGGIDALLCNNSSIYEIAKKAFMAGRDIQFKKAESVDDVVEKLADELKRHNEILWKRLEILIQRIADFHGDNGINPTEYFYKYSDYNSIQEIILKTKTAIAAIQAMEGK